jgi:hypothetical protein
MSLLPHQKITWALPNRPFGRGTLGNYSSATAPTMTKDSCSGTATSNTLTTTSSTFANGDLMKVIQMRGSGAGNYEYVLVVSGGGTGTLTLSKNLVNTYIDSGASQAQAVKVNEYLNVTVQAGTWYAPDWDENVGGVLTLACRGIFTPTGTISGDGATGPVVNGGGDFATSRAVGGFKGGYGYKKTSAGYIPLQGEGTGGSGIASASANGNGGGAPQNNDSNNGCTGAGGANGEAGASVTQNGNSCTGGTTAGDANLQLMVMGGGGAGGGRNDANPSNAAGGGAGGKIISIFAKTITAPTNILSRGGAGGSANNSADGGGGAGGSILIVGGTVDIGSDKLSTTGGLNGGGGASGGKGRIAVYYGRTLTGSVSSSLYGSLTTEQDLTLKEGSGFLAFF